MTKVLREQLLIFFSIFLLSTCLLIVASVSAQPVMLSEDKEAILKIVDDELLSVEKNLLIIKENESTVWAQDDLIFYNFWFQGLTKEREASYKDAIRFYKQAYSSGRYEMSSYAVLMPLGRVYFLIGEKNKAISLLKKFLKEAERDLSSMSMWELSPEGEEALRMDMERARWLMNFCRQ